MAQAHAAHGTDKYYIPHGSKWPAIGAVTLFTTMFGVSAVLNGWTVGPWIAYLGLAGVAYMFFGWFGTVIDESQRGLYNAGVDRSFRMGMMWFIFSEVMFFAAFFGALYYARQLSVPWLGGEGSKFLTNLFLWEDFEAGWPTNGPAARRRRFRDHPGVRPAGDQHRDPAHLGRDHHHRPPRPQGRQPRRSSRSSSRSPSSWASCSSACRPRNTCTPTTSST